MPVILRPLEAGDLRHILRWNEDKDADFLMQWAGQSFVYPLTYDQLLARVDTGGGDHQAYAITLEGMLIGTVELCRFDREQGDAAVARYLIDEAYRCHGYGEEALRALAGIAFNEMGFRRLRLTVFEFNAAAKRCYEKVGFTVYERVVYENGWVALRMELKKRGVHNG